jgi:hypothetical protein
MTTRLSTCDGTAESITQAFREDSAAGIVYNYLGSILIKLKSDRLSPTTSTEIISELKKYSSGLPGTAPHVYKLAEEIRRWALDQKSSRLVTFRGMSGSGKSESMRSMLQHFLFCDNTQILNIGNDERDILKPLGLASNPFLISNDSSIAAKKLLASITLLNMFTTASTDKNPWSSRAFHYYELHFNAQGRIQSAAAIPIFHDMLRCNPKDPTLGPLLIQHLVVHARNKPEYLQLNSRFRDIYTHYKDVAGDNELYHFHEIFTHYGGLTEEHWEQMLRIVASVVHLQNITILGSDTTMISANTKNHITMAEQLLGIEAGSILSGIVKKSDDRPSRPVGSTIEAKPLESKIILEVLCNELLSRLLHYLLDHLRTDHHYHPQMNTYFDSPISQQGSVHILDPNGYEKHGSLTPGNFTHLMNHYVEEKLCGFSIQQQLMGEIYSYQDEGITMDFIKIPSISTYAELLEQNPGGLIGYLDEACAAQKADDKVFADKAILNFGKQKLVKAGGSKSKATTFIIRHSFTESAYDTEGFIFSNKASEIPLLLANALRSSNIPYIATPLSYAPLYHPPPAVDDKPVATTGSIKATKPKAIFTWSKYLQMTDKLLGYLSNHEKKSFVLCVNLSIQSTGTTTSLNSNNSVSTVEEQIQSLLITNLMEISKFGYGYKMRYLDFFERFRLLTKYEHETLPYHINPKLVDDARLKDDSQILMKEVIDIINKLGFFPVDSLRDLSSIVLYGKTMIFLKDSFAEYIERARFLFFERYTNASIKLQAFFRMKLHYRSYKKVKKGSIRFQSFVRTNLQRKKFLKLLFSAKKMKNWMITMHIQKGYLRIKKAVSLIKSKLLGKMVQRIRYQRLLRAAKNFQLLVKGSLLRRQANHVFKAALFLQRRLRTIILRKRFHRIRQEAGSRIQRCYRGYQVRHQLANLVTILKLRREQRIVNKVVQKLQARWRSKLVIARFQEIVQAIMILQRWFQTRICRLRYLKVQQLSLWLQSHARRLSAWKRTNTLKVGYMVQQEKEMLSELYLHEIQILSNKSQQQSLQHLLTSTKLNSSAMNDESSIGYVIPATTTTTTLSVGYTNHGQDKYERLLAIYDLSFDITISYPDGWLPTIISFISDLKEQENRFIELIAVGANHTILVDDYYHVYSMGLGDCGQLGHSNRQSYTKPKRIEHIQRVITTPGDIETQNSHSLAKQTSLKVSHLNQRISILAIACGQDHTLLLTGARKIFSWGDNKRGQLGHSKFESMAQPRIINYKGKQTFHNIRSIACGKFHSVALVDPGVVYVWGAGELTDGIECLYKTSMTKDEEDMQALMQVLSAKSLIFRYNTDRKVVDICEPRAVTGINTRKIYSVVSGEGHIAVLTGDGIYTWGNNTYGQLGIGNTEDSLVLKKINFQENFQDRDWQTAEILSGGRHMMFRSKGRM